jgi:hypothetical protein
MVFKKLYAPYLEAGTILRQNFLGLSLIIIPSFVLYSLLTQAFFSFAPDIEQVLVLDIATFLKKNGVFSVVIFSLIGITIFILYLPLMNVRCGLFLLAQDAVLRDKIPSFQDMTSEHAWYIWKRWTQLFFYALVSVLLIIYFTLFLLKNAAFPAIDQIIFFRMLFLIFFSVKVFLFDLKYLPVLGRTREERYRFSQKIKEYSRSIPLYKRSWRIFGSSTFFSLSLFCTFFFIIMRYVPLETFYYNLEYRIFIQLCVAFIFLFLSYALCLNFLFYKKVYRQVIQDL